MFSNVKITLIWKLAKTHQIIWKDQASIERVVFEYKIKHVQICNCYSENFSNRKTKRKSQVAIKHKNNVLVNHEQIIILK